MDENKNYRSDPWEPGKYETGRTKPPKNHHGLIAVLLVVVIFLSGLVSFLGVLNVRLFAQLQAMPHKEDEEKVSFVSETRPTESAYLSDPSEQTDAAEEICTDPALCPDTFQLNPSPEAIPNGPPEEGLSLQDIYEKTHLSSGGDRHDGGRLGSGGRRLRGRFHERRGHMAAPCLEKRRQGV